MDRRDHTRTDAAHNVGGRMGSRAAGAADAGEAQRLGRHLAVLTAAGAAEEAATTAVRRGDRPRSRRLTAG